MDSSTIIATHTPVLDRQMFGAAVVSKTLDYMNNAGPSYAPTDKQSFGAAVVGKTLDYMNSGNSFSSGMSQSFDFQKSVLEPVYTGTGGIVDLVS